MQLTVSGKQIDVGDALRTHVDTVLGEIIGRFFSHAVNAHVTISKQAHLFRVDIQAHVSRGLDLHSNAEATDPYPAFDQAAERLAARLRRHKSRLVRGSHHNAAADMAAAQNAPYYVIDAEKSDAEGELVAANAHPAIVAEMTLAVETLSVSEAVMRLDLGQLPALLFRNAAHGRVNMVYRRNDGHIGWVDPAAAENSALKTDAATGNTAAAAAATGNNAGKAA